MTKQRNRLTQIEFTKLVMWLKDVTHKRSTISEFCLKASKALAMEISEDSVARAIHEFGLADKLLVAPKINHSKSKLSDKVKILEAQVEDLAFKIFAIEEWITVLGTKENTAASNNSFKSSTCQRLTGELSQGELNV